MKTYLCQVKFLSVVEFFISASLRKYRDPRIRIITEVLRYFEMLYEIGKPV